MTLIDKIMTCMDTNANLLKLKVSSGILGKSLGFSVNGKEYFILVDDDYDDKGKWYLNLLFPSEKQGIYSLLVGKYSDAHWGTLVTKEVVKDKSVRKSRMNMFRNLKKIYDSKSNRVEENKSTEEYNKLEEFFDKLLKENKNV